MPLVPAVRTWSGIRLWLLRWVGGWRATVGRGLPGGNSLFFVSPKKSKQKKGDPAVCVPPSLALRRATCGARSSRGRARLASLKIARPGPSGPALLGAYRRVVGAGSGSGEDALCAFSPPRIGICIRFPHPSGPAEEHSKKWIRASDCLSRRRVRARPHFLRAPQVARSEAEGPGPSGRLLFAYFLLAKQEKVSRPPGRDPACWQTQNLEEQAASTSSQA